MEQALINKLRDGTADDIDVDMIVARCKNAHNQLLSMVDKFTNELEAFIDEHGEELKIAKSTIVMGYQDDLSRIISKQAPLRIVYGNGPSARDLVKQLEELAK